MKDAKILFNIFKLKQLTRIPWLAGKSVDFTLLHHNNARSGKIYTDFSTGVHVPLA